MAMAAMDENGAKATTKSLLFGMIGLSGWAKKLL